MVALLPLIALNALVEKQGRRICTAGLDLAVFRVHGAVFAVDDSCPHAGASLSGGTLQGLSVQCRAHGLRFSVDPSCPHDPAQLEVKKYPVQVIDGMVMLDPRGLPPITTKENP